VQHARSSLPLEGDPPAGSPTKSASLRDSFAVAFRSGHNAATRGASDPHAEMRSKARGLEGDPVIGNSDLDIETCWWVSLNSRRDGKSTVLYSTTTVDIWSTTGIAQMGLDRLARSLGIDGRELANCSIVLMTGRQ